MDFLDALDARDRTQTPERVIRDRTNPFEAFSDFEFYQRFRFNKVTIMEIVHVIENDISYSTDTNFPIPPLNRLLLAIRFYATGNIQLTDSDLAGLHQTTVSRIVKQVSYAIARLRPQFIQFPHRLDEQRMNRRSFMMLLDSWGFWVPLTAHTYQYCVPGGNDAELFRNRKGKFTINVQAVSGPNLEFLNIVARWPGSTHDSRIFDSSGLCGKLERSELDGVLLGDAGYPCRHYLMTPFQKPRKRFTEKIQQRASTNSFSGEKDVWGWKRRFAGLSTGLRLKLKTTLAVIVTTSILHNMAIRMNDPEPDEDIPMKEDNGMGVPQQGTRAGNARRLEIRAQYFT